MRGRRITALFFAFVGFVSSSAANPCPLEQLAPLPPAIYDYLQKNELSAELLDPQAQLLWDNWIVFDKKNGLYHRYSLSASLDYEIVFDRETDRHGHDFSNIRHFISTNMQNWWDLGLAKEKNHDEADAYWSGDTLIVDGKFYLIHTKASRKGRQSLYISISEDGHRFGESFEVLPQSEAFNYDLSEGDGFVHAWRDPSITYNSQTQKFEMVFAAKMRTSDGRTIPTIGRAQAENLLDWELLPPLDLSEGGFRDPTAHQIELPHLIFDQEGNRHIFYSIARDNNDSFALAHIELNQDGIPKSKRNLLTSQDEHGFNVFKDSKGDYRVTSFLTQHSKTPYRLGVIRSLNNYGVIDL